MPDINIDETKNKLIAELSGLKNKADILKSKELRDLVANIKNIPEEERPAYGKAVNDLKKELQSKIASELPLSTKSPIDISAPFDKNQNTKPAFLPSENGTTHPITQELTKILDIFYRMGFTAAPSREIDDDYHMFSSLNFPEEHPARDDYDTFLTVQTDSTGHPLIAPAHTSTMQNRVLKKYKADLENGQAIAVVIPGRVFRNEDLDARHEHTFYQLEGIYVDQGVNVGHLIATLKTFLEAYFNQKLEVKMQPFYFPFTEPSFEFSLSCPFCQGQGCYICSQVGWIELLGCGMIHPSVLNEAGLDVSKYTGFAWGGGIERLVMMKNNIEDIRLFESGRLDFLRQFK